MNTFYSRTTSTPNSHYSAFTSHAAKQNAAKHKASSPKSIGSPNFDPAKVKKLVNDKVDAFTQQFQKLNMGAKEKAQDNTTENDQSFTPVLTKKQKLLQKQKNTAASPTKNPFFSQQEQRPAAGTPITPITPSAAAQKENNSTAAKPSAFTPTATSFRPATPSLMQASTTNASSSSSSSSASPVTTTTSTSSASSSSLILTKSPSPHLQSASKEFSSKEVQENEQSGQETERKPSVFQGDAISNLFFSQVSIGARTSDGYSLESVRDSFLKKQFVRPISVVIMRQGTYVCFDNRRTYACHLAKTIDKTVRIFARVYNYWEFRDNHDLREAFSAFDYESNKTKRLWQLPRFVEEDTWEEAILLRMRNGFDTKLTHIKNSDGLIREGLPISEVTVRY